MKLKTDIYIDSSEAKIDHSQKIYLMGSCFSENIAAKFSYYGFNVMANSHGIIYNPLSMARAFQDLVMEREYTLQDLIQEEGKYLSLNHHGSFEGSDPNIVLELINKNIQEHYSFLKQTSFVFVSVGSVWVYQYKLSEGNESMVVANCHKLPAARFEKKLLKSHTTHESLMSMIGLIRQVNPAAQIVFTISPVKYLKDGFVENQFSKSMLHVLIQESLIENVSYFPAYEIMNDDLRDYRFWKEDMMHPNEQAIDYIWEKFSETYFEEDTLKIMDEVKKTRQFVSHRSLSSDPTEIEKLKKDQQKKLQELTYKYPQIVL